MKTKELKEVVLILELFFPTFRYGGRKLTIHEIENAKKESMDAIGEFKASLRPSECIRMIQISNSIKAKIEEAELDGKDEI